MNCYWPFSVTIIKETVLRGQNTIIFLHVCVCCAWELAGVKFAVATDGWHAKCIRSSSLYPYSDHPFPTLQIFFPPRSVLLPHRHLSLTHSVRSVLKKRVPTNVFMKGRERLFYLAPIPCTTRVLSVSTWYSRHVPRKTSRYTQSDAVIIYPEFH